MVGGCGQEKERRCGGGLPGSCEAPVFVEEGTVGGKRRSSGEKQKGRLAFKTSFKVDLPVHKGACKYSTGQIR